MEFMQKYKHLDKLCKEMNVVGITGYIDAMSKISNGYLLVDG